jgi:hypothetical protein
MLMDVAQSARASGAPLAATHVHAAINNATTARRLLARNASPGPTEGGEEPLFLWNGDPTTFALGREGDQVLGHRLLSKGGFPVPPAIAAHDLGWELQGSDEARSFAADQMSAALLARTLAQTCWVNPAKRSRWSTSMGGAVTLVRLLRRGTAFPILDPYGALVHDGSLAIASSLGWRPAHICHVAQAKEDPGLENP